LPRNEPNKTSHLTWIPLSLHPSRCSWRSTNQEYLPAYSRLTTHESKFPRRSVAAGYHYRWHGRMHNCASRRPRQWPWNPNQDRIHGARLTASLDTVEVRTGDCTAAVLPAAGASCCEWRGGAAIRCYRRSTAPRCPQWRILLGWTRPRWRGMCSPDYRDYQMIVEQARCSEPGDGALVDNRGSAAPGR
jgi:hypothetical protein